MMEKKPRSFRLEEKDIELLDLLTDHYTKLHGIEHSRTSSLVFIIRDTAFRTLKEKTVMDILDK